MLIFFIKIKKIFGRLEVMKMVMNYSGIDRNLVFPIGCIRTVFYTDKMVLENRAPSNYFHDFVTSCLPFTLSFISSNGTSSNIGE